MKKSLLVLSALLINNLSAATLTTDKPSYTTTDTVKINFKEMDNHHKDWIGIYPSDSSTEWKNVLKWAWTQNKSEGTLTFKNLPAGHYEVRGFYNNSYDIEARKHFVVVPNNHPGTKAELSASKAVFQASEDVLINFKNINGATNDWLAIYPADKNNDWENVVKWKFNKGGVKAGQANFDKLAPGNYEARIFYNNTFKMEGKVAFRVDGFVHVVEKLYEDAEGGLKQEWHGEKTPYVINAGSQGSHHSVRVPRSGGYFSFGNLLPTMKNLLCYQNVLYKGEPCEPSASSMKYLVLDTRVGITSHTGNFGVKVKTRKGNRRIIFSSYMNHPNNDMSGHATPRKPFLSDDGFIHYHPAPTDYYLETRGGKFVHYKIDIEKKLQLLEPDNKLISITDFISAGGDFDNIKLSSDIKL